MRYPYRTCRVALLGALILAYPPVGRWSAENRASFSSVCFAAQQGIGPWKTFISQDKSFSIAMPGVPKKEVANAPSPFGPVTVTMYSIEEGQPVYFVGYTDYPAKKLAKFTAVALFQKISDALRKKPGTTVVREKTITVDGYPGRELTLRVGQAAEVIERHVLVKNRMFIMNVVYSQGKTFAPEVSHFFGSFKLQRK